MAIPAPKKTPPSQAAPESEDASLAKLANLGPKSAQFMQRAGITSIEQLKHLGSVRAYSMVKKVEPSASLNLLWALEGALTGLHWQEVAKNTAQAYCLRWKRTSKARRAKLVRSTPTPRIRVAGTNISIRSCNPAFHRGKVDVAAEDTLAKHVLVLMKWRHVE